MSHPENTASQTPWAVIVIVLVAIIAVLVWQLMPQQTEAPVQPVAVVEPEVTLEPEIIEEEIEPLVVEEPEQIAVKPEPVVEEEVVEVDPLPSLDESDSWIQTQLASMTWRKELLKLVINEDMVRRFVVFTDNFAQGLLAYEHSPFTKPSSSFSVLELKEEGTSNATLLWDESSARRFSLYVDLLRSIDSDTLVSWYFEAKPLIDQAYAELGYPEEDFTLILQSAITRVLDMEIPKTPIELTRPSVMYKYKDSELESLDDAEKLLLRIGKDNLLVIKSVLLEFNEKIARERS